MSLVMNDKPAPAQLTQHALVDHQRRLLQLLDEFFQILVGAPAGNFDDFESARRRSIERAEILKKSTGAINDKHEQIAAFYAGEVGSVFQAAKEIGGVKLVLGGTSRFGLPQTESVRKLALYADTILIPDPVLPWLEIDRPEEQFRHVLELRDIYHVLRFRPLVDAELPYPAVVFVPSWEKVLERGDPDTQARQANLIVSVLSYHLGEQFEVPDEIFAFAARRPDEFLSGVERKGLFVPPGHEGKSVGIKEAIGIYREYVRRWRPKYYAEFEKVPDAHLLAVGLIERIAPIYHLLENTDELNAHSLLPLPVHWHYFDLCRVSFAGQLDQMGLIDKSWKAEERVLQDPRLGWLGNVPIAELVRLRQDNENEEFRRHLKDLTVALHDSTVSDLSRVVPDVVRGLSGLLAEHQRRVRAVEEEYQRRHTKTGALSLVTGVATFAPVLAPVLGIVPGAAAALAIAAKYASDKIDECASLSQLSRSLFGVLGAARREEK